MKDLFNIVKKNLEIAQLYLELYAPLKRHEELSIAIKLKEKNNKSKQAPQKMYDEHSELWDFLIKLNIHTVSNFIRTMAGEDGKDGKYLMGKLTANPIKVIKDIKREIKNELKDDSYNPEYKYYDHDQHKQVLDIKKAWTEVKTKEDLFKIIMSGGHEYTTWDYSPFWNRHPELINIVINNDLKVNIDDDVTLDLSDSDGFFKLFKRPFKDQSVKAVAQYEADQKEIESIIEILLPICERAKVSDECWEDNFFNNKIKNRIITRMK